MFIYAAARCLSLTHGFELILDTRSGFAVDRHYARVFELNSLSLPGEILHRSLAYRPPNRWLLSLRRRIERKLPREWRSWVIESHAISSKTWRRAHQIGETRLEGYWQNERYFKPCRELLRHELTPQEPNIKRDADALRMIRNGDSVAVHLRLRDPPSGRVNHRLLQNYYREAIVLARKQAPSGRVYAFSDDIPQAKGLLSAIGVGATFPDIGSAALDLLLMSNCRVLVLAPSTLSWWAAWLSCARGSVVIAPQLDDGWGFCHLLRPEWIRIRLDDSTSSC